MITADPCQAATPSRTEDSAAGCRGPKGSRSATCGEAGATPLELARVCNAWAAGIANARARSVPAPIANRELQKSTGGGRKCGQLFSVEREGGEGGAVGHSRLLTLLCHRSPCAALQFGPANPRSMLFPGLREFLLPASDLREDSAYVRPCLGRADIAAEGCSCQLPEI